MIIVISYTSKLIFLPYLGKADDNKGDIYWVGVGHGLPSLPLATAM